MREPVEPGYVLYVDDSGESQQAEVLLKENKVPYKAQAATQQDQLEFYHPRLITAEGSYIGLPRIRLFALAANDVGGRATK